MLPPSYTQVMAQAKDLVTILYRPRETMRRLLDGTDRWTIQVVVLAAVCASVGDSDWRALRRQLPELKTLSLVALAIGSILAVAIAWAILLFIFTWITAGIARVLGGTAPVRDIRAALAWSLVPVVWSVFYRIPVAVEKSLIIGDRPVDEKEIILNFLANGGCSFIVVLLIIQMLFFIWVVWIASSTVAEAQKWPTAKGFANVALSCVAPLAIIAAAIFAFRL